MKTTPAPLRRLASLLIVPIALAACSSSTPRNGSSVQTTTDPSASAGASIAAGDVRADQPASTVKAVGSQSVGSGSDMPADFPSAVPVAADGLVSATSTPGGDGMKFDLSYAGPDLRAMVAEAKAKLVAAGFTVTGDYDSMVKGVPSAGFVADSTLWQVVVGGQSTGKGANMSLSVVQR